MRQKNLFIRVDSGLDIGLGHVMRCFALAEVIKNMNFNVYFISKEIEGNVIKNVENYGYKVFRIDSKAIKSSKSHWKMDAVKTTKIIQRFKNEKNLLLVDNYELSNMWETWLKLVVDKIIVIDDFLNRSHNCDLFIDQNLHTSKKERNKINCKKLLGPKYALLRKEFVKSRKIVKERSGKINRILVSFGGSDEKNQTLKVLKAIKKLAEEKINVDVIVGEPNKNKTKIKRICAGMKNSTYYQQPKNMAKIMNKADLAIGAGGIITWERCCLGLPSVVSIVSKNQEDMINAISKKGCLINLGRAERLTSEDYLSAIRNLNPKKLIRMQKKCMGLVDGKGTIRVAKHISLIAKR